MKEQRKVNAQAKATTNATLTHHNRMPHQHRTVAESPPGLTAGQSQWGQDRNVEGGGAKSDHGNIGDCSDCQMSRCETYGLFLVFRRALDSDILPDACQECSKSMAEVSLFSTLWEALEYFGMRWLGPAWIFYILISSSFSSAWSFSHLFDILRSFHHFLSGHRKAEKDRESQRRSEECRKQQFPFVALQESRALEESSKAQATFTVCEVCVQKCGIGMIIL